MRFPLSWQYFYVIIYTAYHYQSSWVRISIIYISLVKLTLSWNKIFSVADSHYNECPYSIALLSRVRIAVIHHNLKTKLSGRNPSGYTRWICSCKLVAMQELKDTVGRAPISLTSLAIYGFRKRKPRLRLDLWWICTLYALYAAADGISPSHAANMQQPCGSFPVLILLAQTVCMPTVAAVRTDLYASELHVIRPLDGVVNRPFSCNRVFIL